jgi:hypothetical protein
MRESVGMENGMKMEGNVIPAASCWLFLRRPSAGGEHRAFARQWVVQRVWDERGQLLAE